MDSGSVAAWRRACHSSLAITTITSITFTTTASTTFTTIATITFTTISNNDSITTIIIVAAWRRTCHSSPHLLLLPLLLLGMLYKKSKIRNHLQVADHLPPSLGIAPNYSHFQRASLTAVTNITTKLLLLPLYCHNYYRGYHYHYMIPLYYHHLSANYFVIHLIHLGRYQQTPDMVIPRQSPLLLEKTKRDLDKEFLQTTQNHHSPIISGCRPLF